MNLLCFNKFIANDYAPDDKDLHHPAGLWLVGFWAGGSAVSDTVFGVSALLPKAGAHQLACPLLDLAENCQTLYHRSGGCDVMRCCPVTPGASVNEA